MTDRELLELAAKAAGYRLEWDGHPDQWQPIYYEGKTYHSFNPLTDDGAALRLAHSLEMTLETGEAETLSELRRDIVRAAAAIAQQEQP